MAADLDAFALDDILSPSSSSVYPVNDTEYDYDYADSVNQFNWNELVPTTIVYAITSYVHYCGHLCQFTFTTLDIGEIDDPLKTPERCAHVRAIENYCFRSQSFSAMCHHDVYCCLENIVAMDVSYFCEICLCLEKMLLNEPGSENPQGIQQAQKVQNRFSRTPSTGEKEKSRQKISSQTDLKKFQRFSGKNPLSYGNSSEKPGIITQKILNPRHHSQN
ncbi:unnamed protein product [Nesidiocoris tenuis]|uniref:Uncharacterized protein n=1 Tax=Nesidiocoris tenuis TaxID=355587 RepID=A0A6H5G477_9HEMI|nr:unnamed protein product [Nesidiocoris tenuis]